MCMGRLLRFPCVAFESWWPRIACPFQDELSYYSYILSPGFGELLAASGGLHLDQRAQTGDALGDLRLEALVFRCRGRKRILFKTLPTV